MAVRLLSEMLEEERKNARRGKLKVFFGSAAGVGKTYAMLRAGREAKERGIDVVAAWIAPRDRAELVALADGLERLPPRRFELGGKRADELDLDATLRRKPALALVDELAHANFPGGRNHARWQDVLELLEAGIDVHTTINVENVEGLRDVVTRVTGSTPRSTVPDAVLERAAEIELVDVPIEELLRRHASGKLYPNERARKAYASMFRKGNLLAMRELALRWAAEQADNQVRNYRVAHGIARTWALHERMAVCVGPAPQSAALIRAAHRMATRLKADWYAVFVDSPKLARLSEADQARVAEHLALASRLGGKAVRLRGESVPEILRFAKHEDVTQIVVGKPAHPRWMDVLFGSFVDDLVRKSGNIGIYVIAAGARTVERAA